MPSATMNAAGSTPVNGNSSNVQGSEIRIDRSSIGSSDHSSEQTLITADSLMGHSEHYPFVTVAAATTIQAPTTPFTAQNLDQHNQQQEDEYTSVIDYDEEQRRFDEHVESLRVTLQGLGVDEVPDHFLIGMALKYDGMVSIERLWAEYEESSRIGVMREGYYSQTDLDGGLEGYEDEGYLGSGNAYPH